MTMKIGIPKETKSNEFRVALVPSDAKRLVDFGHEVIVEKDAGKGSGFTNRDYKKAGAKILDSVYGYPMVVRVKEPPLDTIKEGQKIMAYLHVEKGQNPKLLNKLLEKNATSYAYEEIRDNFGDRLVNLGFEAGVVGMYEGLRLFGKTLEKHGKKNVFESLPYIKKYGKEKSYKYLSKLKLRRKVNVTIMGNGRVSAGVQEVLSKAGIKPKILLRDKTPFIENYLPETDILINAVVWYPTDPSIVKRNMLKSMKKTSVIVDISCDKGGAVETCIPTTWDNPIYEDQGITHMCIDNLPSAIPREASMHLSAMVLPYALSVANKEKFRAGLMTKDGVFKYSKPEEQTKLNRFVLAKPEAIVYE
jgi:alanine dehydrogenase